MSKPRKNEMTFEEAFQRLESLVESLEKGEATLEESVRIYEEGMGLVRRCSEALNQAETKLKVLVDREDGGFGLEPME